MDPDVARRPAQPGRVDADGHLRGQCLCAERDLAEVAQRQAVAGQLRGVLQRADHRAAAHGQPPQITGQQPRLVGELGRGSRDPQDRHARTTLQGQSGVRTLPDHHLTFQRSRRRRGQALSVGQRGHFDADILLAVLRRHGGAQAQRRVGFRQRRLVGDRDGHPPQHRRQEIGDGGRHHFGAGERDAAVDEPQRIGGVQAVPVFG
ncbi:hypothetical protein ACQI4F_11360 [Mycolicibacterium vaccae]|uniref:hypothetical protein n=1 Tax=Mycolicibacterium vaccae TaxID=1810 RepID=UPI003CEC14D6